MGKEWPEIHRARSRAYHAAHRDDILAKQRVYRASHNSESLAYARNATAVRRAFVDAARADGCVDCGNKNLAVLHSDHVRGKKLSAVSNMCSAKVPLARLFAELDKCETRCANCHMMITASRKGSYV